MEERRPNLVSALHQMGDFYMELKWDFQSWGMYYVYILFFGALYYLEHLNYFLLCNVYVLSEILFKL